MTAFSDPSSTPATPVHIVSKSGVDAWAEGQDKAVRAWITANGFNGRAGTHCLLPDASGALASVVCGSAEQSDMYTLSALVQRLPAGDFKLVESAGLDLTQLCLGWGLAHYKFDRFRKMTPPAAKLVWPEDVNANQVVATVEAQCLVRDLVTTPTEQMGPDELETVVREVAQRLDAKVTSIRGDRLLEQNFPAVHVVGRASHREPRLIELNWGDIDAPVISIVGKGVCFDTGGLNLKSASGMRLMKKDMGGAAHALGLAQLIMANELPVRLQLLIPAVENAVSGNAYRPGDVIDTRKGLSVEIGNTDAEGRIVLSDALTYASESKPELIIDFATLTGAARVALGTDLPALFCNDDTVAHQIHAAGARVQDPVWQMPLYADYKSLLKSPVADLNNISSGGMGGAITAALFLESFVGAAIPWCHIDTYAWNQKARPGRPEGGEAISMRAVYAYLEQRFG